MSFNTLEDICKNCTSQTDAYEGRVYHCSRFGFMRCDLDVCYACSYRAHRSEKLYGEDTIDKYNVNTFLVGDPD